MASSFKKSKRYLSDSDSETESDFLRFIIIESSQDKKLDQLSPFLIEKKKWYPVDPTQNCKETPNWKSTFRSGKQKTRWKPIEMEKFHNLKCRAYPHAKLNTSKGVVRTKELSLATLEEIETAFKKQGIKEYRRVTIHRNDETIQTHTYILTFEKPSIPKEIGIGYTKGRAVYTSSPVMF